MERSQDDRHRYAISILEEIRKLVEATPADRLKQDIRCYLNDALEYQRELERLYRGQGQI